MRLTVRERILLHLLTAGKFGEALEVPRAATQEGIAEASWIRRRHLSQYIQPMLEEGLVTERKAYVKGIRQRRKVYRLTASGKLKAVTLQGRVMEAPVQVKDEDGTRSLSVDQALSEVGGSATHLEIVRLAMQGEPVVLDELEPREPSEFVTVVRDAPLIEDFVGRRRELEAITGESTDGGRLFVVRGLAGMGKSSLAAEACERLRGRCNLFWHRVRPWDTRDSILSRLGAFLAALGKPGLQAVLKRGDADRAPDVFREDLSGTRSFLVFDDAHEAGSEVLPFFRLLVETLKEAGDVRAVILTRTALSFYNRRDVVLLGVVKELELQGLESHEVAAYLSRHEMPKSSYEVAQRLHGHPLSLELLRAHNPFSDTLVDVRRYLEEEVYASLPDAQRSMMEAASLYRVPVPRDALFANPEWPHDVLLTLLDRSLLRSVGGDKLEVHDTIRDFFGNILTPSERDRLSRFAVGELSALAQEAREAGEFAVSSGYLSNALQLSTAPNERATLWEALGDVSQRIGDILAVSVAYRAAARSASDVETVARARRKMAFALLDRGEVKVAADETEAGFLALADMHSAERGWFHLARSRILVRAIKWVKANDDAKAALSIFQEFGDVRGEAEALMQLAFLAYFGGMGEEGEPSGRSRLESALDLSESLGDPELTVGAHLQLIELIRIETGDADEAMKHFAAIEALPLAMKSIRIRINILQGRARFHTLFTADDASATADLTKLIRVGRQVRDDSAVAQAEFHLGLVALRQGKLDDARRRYEEAAEAARRLGNFRQYGHFLFYACRCCLMQGDVEGFNRILRILEDPEMAKSGLPGDYRKMGGALDQLIKGDLNRSCELFEGVLQGLEAWHSEWGFSFQRPRVHLTYGVALSVMGREGEGEEHIHRAREIYQSRHAQGMLAEADVVESRLTKGLRSIVDAARR